MNTSELQESIIQKIRHTNDDELLNYLNQLLSNEVDQKNYSTIYSTSNEQKAKIKEGQDQILRGDYFTNEQVKKEIDGWLSK